MVQFYMPSDTVAQVGEQMFIALVTLEDHGQINQYNNQYWSIACDSTGSRVVVGANNQGIWSNWGGTFLLNYQNSNIGTVYQVVMDSTGQYVVALTCKQSYDLLISFTYYLFLFSFIAGIGIVYSNYYGATSSWGVVFPFPSFQGGLAMDYTGQYVYACTRFGLYKSSNYGVTWSLSTFLNIPTLCSITSTPDGNNLIASLNNGCSESLISSTDGGCSWNSLPFSLPNSYAIASNGDGSVVMLTGYPGLVYVSYNYGNTFTPIYSISDTWSCVAINDAG